MMDTDKTIREMVAAKVAPLIAQCELIRAEIDRTEAAAPILLDKRERDAARVDAIMRRARVEAVLSELRGVEERVMRLADERWPRWRM